MAGVVLMQRELMVDETPAFDDKHLKTLYEHHFSLRAEMEDAYFGAGDIDSIKRTLPVLEVDRKELNSCRVERFVKDIAADCLFSYGPDLIDENILDLVNGLAFNLHGGLSHWYKGAATMFWPFYFLEPNYCGTTLHYITKKIDAGKIVHHTVPKLEFGDCMHEVACKSIVAAATDVKTIMEQMAHGNVFPGVEQKKNGKLFLEKDWRPEHLRVIYDLYEDKIVDMFLRGEINTDNAPRLIQVL